MSASADELRDALKFVYKWLWDAKERETKDQEWPREYLNDTVRMMVAYQKQKKAR